MGFLVEADKLKNIIRRTPLIDLSRLENSAEHSWHLVLMLTVAREYGPAGTDWMRVMEMVAVHDLVEIDAGDVSAYDVDGVEAGAARRSYVRRCCVEWRRSRRRCPMYGRTCSTSSSRFARRESYGETSGA